MVAEMEFVGQVLDTRFEGLGAGKVGGDEFFKGVGAGRFESQLVPELVVVVLGDEEAEAQFAGGLGGGDGGHFSGGMRVVELGGEGGVVEGGVGVERRHGAKMSS